MVIYESNKNYLICIRKEFLQRFVITSIRSRWKNIVYLAIYIYIKTKVKFMKNLKLMLALLTVTTFAMGASERSLYKTLWAGYTPEEMQAQIDKKTTDYTQSYAFDRNFYTDLINLNGAEAQLKKAQADFDAMPESEDKTDELNALGLAKQNLTDLQNDFKKYNYSTRAGVVATNAKNWMGNHKLVTISVVLAIAAVGVYAYARSGNSDDEANNQN